MLLSLKTLFVHFINLIVFLNNHKTHVTCSTEEERLVKSLFKGYNKLIRPVRNTSDYVIITMDFVLLQLINVYEKEQIMKTNVWLHIKWKDFQLEWASKDYKVGSIRVPYDRVWTPDIVLFNNADGNYEASFKPNVVIYADADDNSPNINWIPPAIYKSSCTIDVKYFPFDEQVCEMRFGSWTFDAQQVRLKRDKPMVNLEDYLPSGTWDVISAPGVETYSKETNRMELVYHFRIRRKTLFYTVNLIIPTVLISFLSIFVFYLPTDEGEKMTLCISILLALVVFLLLVSKILPPTSMVIPLISKYLIFTLMMNIVTILNTVIIINWNYRTPRTHNMPKSVRFIFIEFLPKILFMKRPEEDKDKTRDTDAERDGLINNNSDQYDSTSKLPSNRKLLLSKNLSLELNETEPLTFTNLGLINNTNNKNNKTYSSNANINKLETNGDYIGANLNRSSNLKLNRSQNFLDKNKDTLCSNNSELVNLKLANSNHSIPSNASLAVRPKQQQHKNLDKLFISSKNNKTQNQGQLNNTLIQQQQHKNEVLNRNRFNLNTKSSNGNRNEIEAPNKRVHTQTKLASNDNSNSQRGTKSRRHQQYAQSQSYSLEYDTYTTTSDDDRPCDFSPEILEAADKITYITNHIRSENDYEEIRDDWKYVALVIDRLQLYIFFSVTVIGTAFILFDAPHIFQFIDQQKILRELIDNNKFT